MNLIENTLSTVAVGAPVQFRNLTMFPLTGQQPASATYLTLTEALGAGKCRITEVSESGSVPELFFENHSDNQILLLDGEELRGAKQNRMLNLTLLIGGQLKLKIPVSCVEQGRWHYRKADFEAANTVMYSSARAEKMAAVSGSLRQSNTRHSDQGQVWDGISEKARRMSARSQTGAAEAIFETHRATTDEYKRALRPLTGQRGALFAINGYMVGMDLFDAEDTFGKVFDKLLTSYSIDAIDVDTVRTDLPEPGAAADFLKQIAAAKVDSFKAVGEGHDIRLESRKVVGAALQHEDRLVHLSAFSTGQGRKSGRFREQAV